MKEFADGLWVLIYQSKTFGMDVVLDNKSSSGFPFDKGKSVTRAIKRLNFPEDLLESLTKEYLAKSRCKAHLAPINLLVW